MKKIINLLLILLLINNTNIFGEKFIRSWSFVQSTPTGNNIIEDWIKIEINNKKKRDKKEISNDFDWINYVHFIKNNRLYLLAYEPMLYQKFRMGVRQQFKII